MADEEHLARLQQGVDIWNRWRQEHSTLGPELTRADLNGVNLRRANLYGAYLWGASLIQANLSEVTLRRANLTGANLTGANLNEANLNEANLTGAILRGADLTGAYLKGVDLRRADLIKAELFGTDLSRAELFGANLSGANLSGANLSEAILRRADLIQVNLSGAVLIGAHLSGADLKEANLSRVRLWNTVFANVDLRSVKGLVEVHHDGPSVVELQSVLLPQDGSALHFLRGAGVPDEWIDWYRATMMEPIVYHSVFISYSTKHQDDEDFAKRLHSDLQAHGVRCWFAPHDLKPGEYFIKGIDEAIHRQETFLLLLSRHAVESPWVEFEVTTVLTREVHEQRQLLFPIRLDDTVLTTTKLWAASLRQKRHVADFTHWKEHDAYQQAFTLLLRHLKAQT